jgi:hypothetical protein
VIPDTGDGGAPADVGRSLPRSTARAARDSPAVGENKPAPLVRADARESAAGTAGEAGDDDRLRARPAAEVLADRLASALMHHEPGWRLPRHTALARRYDVSTADIDAAISELVNRHLVRRLPDGQVHRVSPAEYLIPLEGVPGLRSRTDPMAGELTCRRRHTSWRRAPEDICWALRVDPAEQVYVVHSVWVADGEPAASATTYLPAEIAGAISDSASSGADDADEPAPADRANEPAGIPPAGEMGEPAGARAPPGDSRAPAAGIGVPPPRSSADSAAAAVAPDGPSLLPLTSCPELPGSHRSDPAVTGTPAALYVEMQPPPPSVARSLRLSAGQPAALITVRFDDPATGRPAALTVTVLRPELFRIVVQTAEVPLLGGEQDSMSAAWAHTAEGWEP